MSAQFGPLPPGLESGTGTSPEEAPRRISRRRLLASAVRLAGSATLAVACTPTGPGPTAPLPTSPAPATSAPPSPPPVIEERVLGVRRHRSCSPTLGQVDGLPAIIVMDEDHQLRVRELTSDRDVGQPIPNMGMGPGEAGVADVDGRAVLVIANFNGAVEVIDLRTSTRSQIGTQAPGIAATAATFAGRPIAATLGVDWVVRRWDLRTQTPLGELLVLPERRILRDLTTTVVHGRLWLVAETRPGVTQVWDAETGEPVARANDTGQITVLDGVPVLVDTHPVVRAVTAVDLRTGAVVRRHDVEEEILLGAIGVLDGRPVIATSGWGNTIVIRDLDTGRQLGAPLAGHEATPSWLGVADLKGRPVLVSTAEDNTIRVWDLAVRAAGQ
jgi:hypothetical protein